MSSYFELSYFKRLARINYILLTVYITIALSSIAIAGRLVTIDGFPIISAGFIYMSTFVITDIATAYNSRKFAILLVIIEACSICFFVLYTNLICQMPYPNFFHNSESYNNVFSPVIALFLANLTGNFIAEIIDIFIFYYFYSNKKFPFFLASLISSAITLIAYTIVTDYFGFLGLYPHNVWELTYINIFTNIITLLIYTFIGQLVLYFIFRYLNKNKGLK